MQPEQPTQKNSENPFSSIPAPTPPPAPSSKKLHIVIMLLLIAVGIFVTIKFRFFPGRQDTDEKTENTTIVAQEKNISEAQTPTQDEQALSPIPLFQPDQPTAEVSPLDQPTTEPLQQAPQENKPEILNGKDQIINYLKTLHITSSIIKGNQSKMTIDGQIYKVGDVINTEYNIRWTKIDEKKHTASFTDSNNNVYLKKL